VALLLLLLCLQEWEGGDTKERARSTGTRRKRANLSPPVRLVDESCSRSGGRTQFSSSPPATATPTGSTSTEVVWQKGPMLGKGAFGTVFEAVDVRTGELLAVKELILPASPSGQEVAAIRGVEREVEVMRSLRHPNIVRYLGAQVAQDSVTASQRCLNIFVELVPGGSLASFIRRYGRCREPLVANFVRQIVEGLAYLHAHGFAHRDVKAANVLVAPDGTLKLCDFGCSKKLDIISLTQGCTTLTGTPHYMAPEVVLGKPYGRKADLWSVGAVMVEMATGQPPWSDLAPVAALFRLGSPDAVPAIPSFLSPDARHFLGLCFTRDPKQRPSAADLLAHPFLRGSSSSSASLRPWLLYASSTPHRFVFQQVPHVEAAPLPEHEQRRPDETPESTLIDSNYRLTIGIDTDTMITYGE